MKFQLLVYLLEASICQSVFYLFYHFFLKKETFFVWSRCYILAVILISTIIPVIEIPLQHETGYFPEASVLSAKQVSIAKITSFSNSDSNITITEQFSTITSEDIVFYSYILVCVLLFIRFVYRLSYLGSLILKCTSIKAQQYYIIYTNGTLPTFSFFHWIFWDNTQKLSQASEPLILEHELAHIRQRHSLDNILKELAKIVFWFNPTVYLFKKHLQQLHEYLADAAVIHSQNTRIYIQLLVEQLFKNLNFNFATPFNQSEIKQRIAMIESYNTAKPAFWKMSLSLPVLCILVFIYSCQPKNYSEQDYIKPIYSKNTYQLPGLITGARSALFNEETLSANGHYPKQDYDDATYPLDGEGAFTKYVRDNLRESGFSKPLGSRRRVYVQYTVDEHGNVRNPTIMNGMGAGYDEAALAIIRKSPKWMPARKNGVPIKSTMVYPVVFGQKEFFSNPYPDIKILAATPIAGEPIPEGSLKALLYLLHKNLTKYPQEAREKLIEGNVVISFTVQVNGKPDGYEIVKSVHPSLDQEVLRITQAANMRWKPAMKNGRPYATKILIPFYFSLFY